MISKLDIPQRLLDHTRVCEMAAKPGPVRDRWRVSESMVTWMHDNADQPFRFVPIAGEYKVSDRPVMVGCMLSGSPDDLVLFRIKFGF